MGVPINPTNSIVKESQRIGRVGRIPEQGMPPAVILIPCMVDATKYACMDTAEQRDQMIREELSECGNFNTAMCVISAFKYQYDQELFEMCLMYPNKYAPQEIKSNLEKQGLVVEESKGDLLDNLSYVCEKEDIEIDKESFEGDNERDILNEIAELTEKTIEVHTQNHDEPIMYINGEVSDEEPLRLFYCEDDNTYAPIVKKYKTRNIKRNSTTHLKKRSRLFHLHTHPDLEVLWKISESSIDLNKSFSQGILDVDITWKEENWMKHYNILEELDEIPIGIHKTEDGVNIGRFIDPVKRDIDPQSLLKVRSYVNHILKNINDFADFFSSTKLITKASYGSLVNNLESWVNEMDVYAKSKGISNKEYENDQIPQVNKFLKHSFMKVVSCLCF